VAREASEVVEHVRRMRGKFLNEAWEALRDAPGGPMLDAMSVIADLAELNPWEGGGDAPTGD
jgi:hypothetical protein